MANKLAVRFRVDFGSRCSVGIGKIELLEGIARSGFVVTGGPRHGDELPASVDFAGGHECQLRPSRDPMPAWAAEGGGGVVLTVFGSRLVVGVSPIGIPPAAFAVNTSRTLAGTSRAVHQEAHQIGLDQT